MKHFLKTCYQIRTPIDRRWRDKLLISEAVIILGRCDQKRKDPSRWHNQCFTYHIIKEIPKSTRWHNVTWSVNKNAFQHDAYHPLQWPSRGVCLGGCMSVQGGVCQSRGCLLREGVCLGGVCVGGYNTPYGQNSSNTLVKTLPFRNYCCG